MAAPVLFEDGSQHGLVLPPGAVGSLIIVVGEVSAKRQVDKKHFQTQLKQALKRSVERAEQYPGFRVFGFALNGGDISGDRKVQGWWEDFRVENAGTLVDNPNVSLPPANVWNAALAMLKLHFNVVGEYLQFGSGLLAKAFDAMIESLSPVESEPPTKAGWMTDMLMESGSGGPQLTGDSGGTRQT